MDEGHTQGQTPENYYFYILLAVEHTKSLSSIHIFQ